jgi:hypothetical protein
MKCQECGYHMKSTCLIQMKVPGTANTYDPKDRRKVCKSCRKGPDYRGRFRLIRG